MLSSIGGLSGRITGANGGNAFAHGPQGLPDAGALGGVAPHAACFRFSTAI
jgi:hypothetical protein